MSRVIATVLSMAMRPSWASAGPIRPAQERPAARRDVATVPVCHRCGHAHRIGQRVPGEPVVYCAARTELRPAYGPGHPLRRLPRDGGASCERFTAREAA